MTATETDYEIPQVLVPTRDSAKIALERHAQNWLCLHIMANRNVQYLEKLAQPNPLGSKGRDEGTNMLRDDSFHVQVPSLELHTPFGVIQTKKFTVNVLVPGLSIYFPSESPYVLDFALERAYQRLQVGAARVSGGQSPAWVLPPSRAAYMASDVCESEIFALLELMAKGLDQRCLAIPVQHYGQAAQYSSEMKLRQRARMAATIAWLEVEKMAENNLIGSPAKR